MSRPMSMSGKNLFSVFTSDADEDPWSKVKKKGKTARTRKQKKSQQTAAEFYSPQAPKSEKLVKLEKQIKNLKKKLQSIDNLETRRMMGQKLNKDQIQKMDNKESLEDDMERLQKRLKTFGIGSGQGQGQGQAPPSKSSRNRRRRKNRDPEHIARLAAEEKQREQELNFQRLLQQKMDHDRRQELYLQEEQQKQLHKHKKKHGINTQTKKQSAPALSGASAKPGLLNTLTKCEKRLAGLKKTEERLKKVERDFSLGLSLGAEDRALFDNKHEIIIELKELQKKMAKMLSQGQVTAQEKGRLLEKVEKKLQEIQMIEKKVANGKKLSPKEKKMLKRKNKFIDQWGQIQRVVPMDIKEIELCFAPAVKNKKKAISSQKNNSKSQLSGSQLIRNWQSDQDYTKSIRKVVKHSRRDYELMQLKQKLKYVEDIEEKWQKGRLQLSPKQLELITGKQQIVNRIKDFGK